MSLPAWLGLELPIIQAPMAGVQGSALAAAVCNAGGLGSLPAAMLSLDALREELSRLRGLTSGPYNVNFFCHPAPAPDDAAEHRWRAALAPYYAELGLDAGNIAAGPGRAPFGAAAAELLARVKAWGARVLSSATTVDEALWLQAHGADAIIAQGLEAGGHRGMFLSQDLSTQVGTLALVPQIVRAVRLPVIAAGGIAHADSVRAVLALGAVAAQVGTAYLLCPEASTSALHRAALRSPDARHTALTRLFTGRPARGIVNRLMRELGPMSAAAPAFPLATAAIAPLRARAESLGSTDFSPLWSGQDASGCADLGAAALTRRLAGVAPAASIAPPA
jgi:nitronate monooxygenase